MRKAVKCWKIIILSVNIWKNDSHQNRIISVRHSLLRFLALSLHTANLKLTPTYHAKPP